MIRDSDILHHSILFHENLLCFYEISVIKFTEMEGKICMSAILGRMGSFGANQFAKNLKKMILIGTLLYYIWQEGIKSCEMPGMVITTVFTILTFRILYQTLLDWEWNTDYVGNVIELGLLYSKHMQKGAKVENPDMSFLKGRFHETTKINKINHRCVQINRWVKQTCRHRGMDFGVVVGGGDEIFSWFY